MTNAILPEIILSDNNEHYFIKDPSNNFVYDSAEHPQVNINRTLTSIFNTTSLVLFVVFLIIYFLIYYGLGKLFGTTISTDILKTRSINLSIGLLLIVGCLYFYYTLPKINQEQIFTYLMLVFKDEMNDPNMVGVMILVLILYYLFVWVMGFPTGKDTKPFFLEIMEYKSWAYLILLVIIMFFIYGLHIEIVDYFYQKGYEWWNDIKKEIVPSKSSPAPAPSPSAPVKPSVKVAPVSTRAAASTPTAAAAPPSKEEVFNIGNNLYTYEDAQAICKSYDARLATYDEVEEAYKDGAEWCNYGWSDGQMIFFPTQKSTWNALQKNPKTAHKCGRPGVNGGYMTNPYIKFGVNCYGKKPAPNPASRTNVNVVEEPTVPKEKATPPDPAVEYWKTQQNNLRMNPYNAKEWSEYSNIS